MLGYGCCVRLYCSLYLTYAYLIANTLRNDDKSREDEEDWNQVELSMAEVPCALSRLR